MLNGIENRRLRDFMKDDTAGMLLIKPENLTQMPGNGLSLAVLIGCEPDLLGLLGSLLQAGHHLLLIFRNLILRL